MKKIYTVFIFFLYCMASLKAGLLLITATCNGTNAPIISFQDPHITNQTDLYILSGNLPTVSTSNLSQTIQFTGSANTTNGVVSGLKWQFITGNPPSTNVILSSNNATVSYTFPAGITYPPNTNPSSITCGVSHYYVDTNGITNECSASSNSVIQITLLPLQLRLLNGATSDFDGSIPVNILPYPENPQYSNDVDASGGCTALGVLPMGEGRDTYPSNAYTVSTIVAAQVPLSIAGIQYQWQRFMLDRSWYIQKQTSTNGTISWYVTQRFARGTETKLFNDSGESIYNNTIPSSVKREFYIYDDSAIAYGNLPEDTNGFMPVGSYIFEEKAFSDQLNISFDGTNWTAASVLPVEQTITVKYQSTNGTTAASNWIGYPTLQAGNVFTNGYTDPIIKTNIVQGIVGSTNITIDPSANY